MNDKPRKTLTIKEKKIIKWSALGTFGVASGTVLTVFSVNPDAFSATQDAVIGFWVGDSY